MKIETLDARCYAEGDIQAIVDLLMRVFTTSKKTREQRVVAMREDWCDYAGPEAQHPRSFLVRDGERMEATITPGARD